MNGLFACLIVLAVVLGLTLASLFPVTGPWAVAAGVLVLLLAIAGNSPSTVRRRMLRCLLLATLGELVLSLVFGLYDYRGGGIPAFVPPGHVLLFLLGVWISRSTAWPLERWVAALAGALALVLALAGVDQLSLLLLLVYLLACWQGPAPRLYGVMFLLALALELLGTALGVWTWRPQVPGLGLRTLNPPLSAGAFYCLLDWLVDLGQDGVNVAAWAGRLRRAGWPRKAGTATPRPTDSPPSRSPVQ